MVSPSATSADKFVNAPPPAVSGFLLYGSDSQQITSRAGQLARSVSSRAGQSSDLVRLHETEAASDPDRILVELDTRPLFGGRRLLWIMGLPAKSHTAIIEAVSRAPLGADVIIEAPDLKKSHKITQVFEKATHLAAISCYGEDEASLSRLIREHASSLGCVIDSDAAALIASRTNVSALLARAETEKLAAFAGLAKKITLEDVEICLTDQRTADASEAVDAALQGDGRAAMIAFERLMAGEGNVVPVLVVLSTSLQRLHSLRTTVESGVALNEAINGFRPPIFFKQQPAISRQVETWPLGALEASLQYLNATVKETRLKAQLAEALTANLLIHIARKARELRKPALSR